MYQNIFVQVTRLVYGSWILESEELGARFNITSRDIEISGIVNLLGKEQHGNISAIGLGLYTQLFADEIERLKKAS